jgi:signal transduction histidine kinase
LNGLFIIFSPINDLTDYMSINQDSHSPKNDQPNVDVYRELFESGLELIRDNQLPDKIILDLLKEYSTKLESASANTIDPAISAEINPIILLAVQEKLLAENQNLVDAKLGYEEILNLLTHEFKNLLTTVHGYNLIMEKKLHEQQEDDLLNLHFAGDRVIKKLFILVDSILKMSLGEKGLLKPDYRLMDFNSDVLKPLESELNYDFSLKSLHINKKIKAKKTMIMADEQLIEIIMRNLLENVAKYSDADSTVNILIENEKNKLVVSIKNFCQYIPENICDNIFEKFKSIKLTGIKSGTGIGLYNVRNLLRVHQGDISCVSAPKKWIKFKISIPFEPERGEI